jgi:hypothetical protein
MSCAICTRPTQTENACRICHYHLRGWLQQIPALQREASDYIQPGRSGAGTVTTERSIGVNVNALDYAMATWLPVLHSWESEIRNLRSLTPPALLNREATIELEVEVACKFQLTHLEWSIGQDWIADFYDEVKELHAKGMAAAKRFVERPRRIPCPTDDCKKFVVIDVEFLMGDVKCFGCKNEWSLLRLIALAMTNKTKKFYLDVEAIALWLGVSERQVWKIIKANSVSRKGQLYDISEIVALRSA